MNQAVSCWDRVMFTGLLILVSFLPYSSAMIEVGLLTMGIGWVIKRSIMFKLNPQKGFWSNYSFESYGLFWPLMIIGALIVLTTPFSNAPALTLKKFFSIFLQQILLAFITVEVISTPKRLYTVMVMLLGTLAVVNADAIVQYVRGESFIFSNRMYLERVNGPMRHPNDLGTLLVTNIPVVFSLVLTKRFWLPFLFPKRLFLVITGMIALVLLCSLISLGLTASRGAWLVFIVTSLGFVFYLKNYRLKVMVIISLVLFLWIFGERCISARTDIHIQSSQEQLVNQSSVVISDSSLKDSSSKENSFLVLNSFVNANGRIVFWKAAIDIAKQYPVFGCGYNAYIQTIRKMQLGHEEYPHNGILQILAELGIIGLLAYLWFFGALFLAGLRLLKKISFHQDLYILGCGVSFGTLAWFIHSLTDTAWASLKLKFLWWLMIGILLSLGKVSEQLKLSKQGG